MALFELEAAMESEKDALELLRWNCPWSSSHKGKAYIIVECSGSPVEGRAEARLRPSFKHLPLQCPKR